MHKGGILLLGAGLAAGLLLGRLGSGPGPDAASPEPVGVVATEGDLPGTDATLPAPALPEALEARVRMYWKAVRQKRWDLCYHLENPAYQAKVGIVPYLLEKGNPNLTIIITGAEVLEVTEDDPPETATTRVRLTHRSPSPFIPGEMERVVEEPWRRVNGGWYRDVAHPFVRTDASSFKPPEKATIEDMMKAAKAKAGSAGGTTPPRAPVPVVPAP